MQGMKIRGLEIEDEDLAGHSGMGMPMADSPMPMEGDDDGYAPEMMPEGPMMDIPGPPASHGPLAVSAAKPPAADDDMIRAITAALGRRGM